MTEPTEPSEPTELGDGALPDAAAATLFGPLDRRPDAWPDELPWLDDERLPTATIERSDSGDQRAMWDVEASALEDLRTRMLEQLHNEGYTDARPCQDYPLSDGWSCALQRDDRPAVLSGRPRVEEPEDAQLVLHYLPPGHQVRTKLPGKCVVPPRRERWIAIESMASSPGRRKRSDLALDDDAPLWGANTWEGPDLDGDGLPEIYVPRLGKKNACPWEIPYSVYVMRGRCGHRVGTVRGDFGDEVELAPFSRGLRRLEASAEWSDRSGSTKDPIQHTVVREYAFDGTALRKVNEHHDRGRCHHCSVLLGCRQAS